MSFISKSALTHEKSIDIHCLDLFFELKVLKEVIQTKEKKITPFFFFYNCGQLKSLRNPILVTGPAYYYKYQ